MYYDLTAIKRGAYTIIFLVDVTSEVLLQDKQKEREVFQHKLSKLEEELQDYDKMMNEPSFWNNQEQSKSVLKKVKIIKKITKVL